MMQEFIGLVVLAGCLAVAALIELFRLVIRALNAVLRWLVEHNEDLGD
jgi:hypothetical protein